MTEKPVRRRAAVPQKPASGVGRSPPSPAGDEAAFAGFGLNGAKLRRPESRADAVPRRRLVSRLLRETAPLCLISAPSGAGKTLAVSQWLEADERPSAWLHLDRGDNDPVTLLRYLARALERVAEVPSAVFSWLQLPQPPVAEAILPALTIAAVTAPPFIFVIDDVQRVREARCWAASWPTLTALPEGSTVVLCGRADPPLPLARLRAEGRLAEYHFGDLARRACTWRSPSLGGRRRRCCR